MELVCGNIYCWECRDYIYDSRIDAVMKEVEQTLRGRQVSGKDLRAVAMHTRTSAIHTHVHRIFI